MLSAAKHLAADRDRPFAALRVTGCDCSNRQGQFVQIEPCLTRKFRLCQSPSWSGRNCVWLLGADCDFVGDHSISGADSGGFHDATALSSQTSSRCAGADLRPPERQPSGYPHLRRGRRGRLGPWGPSRRMVSWRRRASAPRTETAVRASAKRAAGSQSQA